MQSVIATLFIILSMICSHALAATPCTLDNSRVQAGKLCLVARVINQPSGPEQRLAIIVHGDGGGFVTASYLDRLLAVAARISQSAPDDGVVVLQRPGYRSPLGTSEGHARMEDDDYTAENVQHLAAAVRTLRSTWKSSRVVWVGHSGGAALGALVLGREAGVADAAVLAGCPCGSIREWRTHRNASRGRPSDGLWPRSLSPVDHMSALSPGMEIILITGDRDENTLARFNEPWLDKALSRGVNARMITLPGIGHGGVIDSPDLTRHTVQLLKETQ